MYRGRSKIQNFDTNIFQTSKSENYDRAKALFSGRSDVVGLQNMHSSCRGRCSYSSVYLDTEVY